MLCFQLYWAGVYQAIAQLKSKLKKIGLNPGHRGERVIPSVAVKII